MLTQVGPARPQALLPGPSFAPSAADRTCASGSTGGRGARGGPDAWSVRVLALRDGSGHTPCRSPSLRPPGTASFPASNNARGRAGRARNSPACVCLRSRLRRSGRGFPSARRGRTGVHIRKAAPGNAVTGREIQPHPVGRRRPPRSLTTLGLPPPPPSHASPLTNSTYLFVHTPLCSAADCRAPDTAGTWSRWLREAVDSPEAHKSLSFEYLSSCVKELAGKPAGSCF